MGGSTADRRQTCTQLLFVLGLDADAKTNRATLHQNEGTSAHLCLVWFMDVAPLQSVKTCMMRISSEVLAMLEDIRLGVHCVAAETKKSHRTLVLWLYDIITDHLVVDLTDV